MSEIVPRHQLPSGGFGQSRSMRQIATNYGRYGGATFGRSDIAYDSTVLDSPHSGGRCRAPHPEAAMPLHYVPIALVPTQKEEKMTMTKALQGLGDLNVERDPDVAVRFRKLLDARPDKARVTVEYASALIEALAPDNLHPIPIAFSLERDSSGVARWWAYLDVRAPSLVTIDNPTGELSEATSALTLDDAVIAVVGSFYRSLAILSRPVVASES